MKHIVVIGAGVAGLAAACRLQHAGYDVTLFEKEPRVGGKMGIVEGKGFRFDVGPTIVMMPELYREVFEECGRDPDAYIPMRRVEPMLKLNFSGEPPLAMTADLVPLSRALEAVSEHDTQGYLAYLASIYKRYGIAKKHFINRPFRKPTDFYNPKSLLAGLRLHTLGDAYSSISRYVQDERLRKALAFQTLYIGISPYEGPSLYTMIPMIELLYGVWFIEGGMHTMAEGMKRLFLELGGTLRLSTKVDKIEIEQGEAKGVWANGRPHPADAVVCNADFPYAMKKLVQRPRARGKYTPAKIDGMEYSCSCFVLYLGLDKQYPVQALHTIRFARDFKRNVEDIFSRRQFPGDPSFYIYVPSEMDKSLAPEGMQGVYLLVPVAPLDDEGSCWDKKNTARYRNRVLQLVEQETAFTDIREHIIFEKHFTPNDFARHFNAYRGATFGLRPSLRQSNYWRPHNKAGSCERLYFCGSSVHPGAGVPIVLTSAKLAVEELIKDDLC